MMVGNSELLGKAAATVLEDASVVYVHLLQSGRQ